MHSAFPSVARSDRPDGRPANTVAGGWGGADAEPAALDAYATQAVMHAPLLRTASMTVLPPHCAFELWRRGRSSIDACACALLCIKCCFDFARPTTLLCLCQPQFTRQTFFGLPRGMRSVPTVISYIAAFRGRRWVLACPQGRPAVHTHNVAMHAIQNHPANGSRQIGQCPRAETRDRPIETFWFVCRHRSLEHGCSERSSQPLLQLLVKTSGANFKSNSQAE